MQSASVSKCATIGAAAVKKTSALRGKVGKDSRSVSSSLSRKLLSSCFQSKSCKTVPESQSMLTHFWFTANQWNSTNSNVICFLSLLHHLLLLLLLPPSHPRSITPLLLSALQHLHLLQFPAGKRIFAPHLETAPALVRFWSNFLQKQLQSNTVNCSQMVKSKQIFFWKRLFWCKTLLSSAHTAHHHSSTWLQL